MIKLAALAVAAAALVACTGDATDSTQSTQDVSTTDAKTDKKGVEIVADDLAKFGDLSERIDLQPDLELDQPVDGTPVASQNAK